MVLLLLIFYAFMETEKIGKSSYACKGKKKGNINVFIVLIISTYY